MWFKHQAVLAITREVKLRRNEKYRFFFFFSAIPNFLLAFKDKDERWLSSDQAVNVAIAFSLPLTFPKGHTDLQPSIWPIKKVRSVWKKVIASEPDLWCMGSVWSSFSRNKQIVSERLAISSYFVCVFSRIQSGAFCLTCYIEEQVYTNK